MADLRVRFGLILAFALFPILLFSIFMAVRDGQILLVIISILAWIFAYFSLWVTTDKLVFTHLRQIKSASDKFAMGDLEARVGSLNDAPDRIIELASAFDHMATSISERESRLTDNLDEKETLLREIHHRVKNNLQIIISLLNMQERKLKDASSLTALKETRGRINAIALVHRGLYEGDDFRVVNMCTFLTRLIDDLKSGLGIENQDVEIDVQVASVKFEPDTAIPSALFIVEALTNATKHGVPDGGVITVSLKKEGERVNVSVSDTGHGCDDTSPAGTGSKLMRGFARQLAGKFHEENLSPGHKVTLIFPAPNTH